jgi:hypothetical protein
MLVIGCHALKPGSSMLAECGQLKAAQQSPLPKAAFYPSLIFTPIVIRVIRVIGIIRVIRVIRVFGIIRVIRVIKAEKVKVQ